ncbi:hypothetical protein HDU98_011877 [Podochytrium sp. JEL0797]|nr:hypothetical protein HDU98_011877 [Podochytrium sp. JEL0797]
MASTFTIAATGITPAVKEGSADWFMITDQEEGENLAVSIVESIVNRGQEVLFEKHIESQVLPYAVQFAKGTLLKILQPHPAIIDSWARGAIPIKNPLTTKTTALMIPATKLEESTPTFNSIEMISASTSAESIVDSLADMAAPGRSRNVSAIRVSSSSASSVASRGSKVCLREEEMARRTNTAGNSASSEPEKSVTAITERAIVEENKRVIARIQGLEREKAKVGVGYDSEGRILVVKKVGASKLFTQGVKTKVIPEPHSTHFKPTPPLAPPAESNPTFSKKMSFRKSIVKMGDAVPTSQTVRFRESQTTVASRTTLDAESSMSIQSMEAGFGGGGFVPDLTLDIPLLTETMRLAPGVTLKEGDAVKKGPNALNKVPNQRTALEHHEKLEPGMHPKTKLIRKPAATTNGILESDPVLKTVLNKAKPTLRPIPFPVMAVRSGVQGRTNASAFKKLPNITA